MKYEYDGYFGEIKFKETIIYLTPLENKIFYVLEKRKKVTWKGLCNFLYHKEPDYCYKRCIRVAVCRINKKIKNIGKIECIPRFGFEFITKDSLWGDEVNEIR